MSPPAQIYLMLCSSRENWEKCTDSRSWSRMLTIAAIHFTSFGRGKLGKFVFQLNLLFQINTRQLFCPLRHSALMCTTSWYLLFRWDLCHKTVLDCFKFRYFSWHFSHHRAYVAVPVTWMAVLLFRWVCAYQSYNRSPANAIFPQLELIQTIWKEFVRDPVSVSCTQLTGMAQATGHTHKLGEACSCCLVNVTIREWLPVVLCSSA